MDEERAEELKTLKEVLIVMKEISSKSDDLYREMREIKVRLTDMNK